uniref:Dienelactone hydrolase domain-containing protein n=1 Tax=Arcella intermedia TaxID=1963864 RepID=A0A6B2LGN7_9EUKA
MICDQLAYAGFNVYLPDFQRGDPFNGDWPTFKPWVSKTPWSKVNADLQVLTHHLKQNGAASIGIMGFCWGSWVVFHASASADIKAGICVHPAIVKLSELFEENLDELVDHVKAPQLILNAGNDSDLFKEGGKYAVKLKERGLCEVVDYPDMTHGWVPRGNLSDPAVEAAVIDVTNRVIEYFQKHL